MGCGNSKTVAIASPAGINADGDQAVETNNNEGGKGASVPKSQEENETAQSVGNEGPAKDEANVREGPIGEEAAQKYNDPASNPHMETRTEKATDQGEQNATDEPQSLEVVDISSTKENEAPTDDKLQDSEDIMVEKPVEAEGPMTRGERSIAHNEDLSGAEVEKGEESVGQVDGNCNSNDAKEKEDDEMMTSVDDGVKPETIATQPEEPTNESTGGEKESETSEKKSGEKGQSDETGKPDNEGQTGPSSGTSDTGQVEESG